MAEISLEGLQGVRSRKGDSVGSNLPVRGERSCLARWWRETMHEGGNGVRTSNDVLGDGAGRMVALRCAAIGLIVLGSSALAACSNSRAATPVPKVAAVPPPARFPTFDDPGDQSASPASTDPLRPSSESLGSSSSSTASATSTTSTASALGPAIDSAPIVAVARPVSSVVGSVPSPTSAAVSVAIDGTQDLSGSVSSTISLSAFVHGEVPTVLPPPAPPSPPFQVLTTRVPKPVGETVVAPPGLVLSDADREALQQRALEDLDEFYVQFEKNEPYIDKLLTYVDKDERELFRRYYETLIRTGERWRRKRPAVEIASVNRFEVLTPDAVRVFVCNTSDAVRLRQHDWVKDYDDEIIDGQWDSSIQRNIWIREDGVWRKTAGSHQQIFEGEDRCADF